MKFNGDGINIYQIKQAVSGNAHAPRPFNTEELKRAIEVKYACTLNSGVQDIDKGASDDQEALEEYPGIPKKEFDEVFNLFMENPHWRQYYENAPTEVCKEYISMEFYNSEYETEEAEEVLCEMEDDLALEDWKYLLKYCGNNPRKAFIHKVIQTIEEFGQYAAERFRREFYHKDYSDKTILGKGTREQVEAERMARGELLNKAIIFATEKHRGSFRKGTNIPYIVHPMEVAAIVAGITDDEEVMAAAVLHDTVEDTGTGIDEIRRTFGNRVADLVSDESENKREEQDAKDTWRIRKQETIDHMAHASREAKIIALGDKLSNIRAMKRDYEKIGDELWDRFNQKDPKEHGWYYRSIGEKLESELGSTLEWKEYMRLVKEVFGE